MIIVVKETPFEEVRFQGGLSWGEALNDATDADQEPKYPLSFGADLRSGSNARAFVTCGLPGKGPSVVEMTRLDAGGSFTAAIGTVKIIDTSGAYGGASVKFVDNGLSKGVICGFLRCRSNQRGPAFWWSTDGLVNVAVSNYAKSLSQNCSIPLVVTEKINGQHYVIASTASSRDPGGGDQGFKLLDQWILVAKLSEATNTSIGVRAFEWYKIGVTSYYDHSASEENGPGSNGVGSMTLIPGGVWITTGETQPPPAWTSDNIANQVGFKVDCRRLTGETTTPDMSPDVVMNRDRSIVAFRQSDQAVAPSNFRPKKALLDMTLGRYDNSTGVFSPRITGTYRITIAAVPKCDGVTTFEMQLWDVERNVAYVDPYADSPTVQRLCQTRLPTGCVVTARDEVTVYLRAYQDVALRVTSGTALASSTQSAVTFERIL